MMMNAVKQKLAAGECVFGTWSTLTSASLCEVSAQTGIDFQILDMEHGAFDFESLENCIRAIEHHGCSPLVRIAGLEINDVQKALDLGAHGLIFPQVRGVADSERAVQFCQFAPKGLRGFNPFTRYRAFSVNPESKVFRGDDDFALKCIILENKEALSELDQILKIKDLDLVYLGAYDMSVVLGKPGQMDSPEVQEFIVSGIKKIRDAGKYVGLMTSDPEMSKHYRRLGANMIVMGVDSYLIAQGLKKQLQNFTSSPT